MMWKTRTYARASALPAIAAALALSSTPAWSQEVQPTVEPDPIVIDPPAPVLESAPVTTDEAPETVTETATETAPAAKPKPKGSARSTAAAKKATVTRVASAAPAEAAAAPAPETVPPPSQPVVEARPQAEHSAPEQAAAKPALPVDEDVLMLGGGALALLALGGGAVAMTRRRRDEDEVIETPTTDESMAAEPAPSPRHGAIHEQQPAIVVPSAFAWGEPQRADRKVERRQGETWVERAYRGPTPDNPSLSLRKRLKRANFFDARERRVAAGKAKPIPTDAGLPENVEVPSSSRERELELA